MSSSEGDADSPTGLNVLRHADLSDAVFRSYVNENDEQDLGDKLAKVRSVLTSSASGALSCLICLERIKLTDPTWSCIGSCFSIFHLICIQSWARQASLLAADRITSRLPVSHAQALQTATWNCPKCRSPNPATQIPKQYLCFCGKVENPPADNPWIVPHSCGEVCGRSLSSLCGHLCLLLCHPGPCPPCPKLVTSYCFCLKRTEVRRCGSKGFSCGHVCRKPLPCGAHLCPEICHESKCSDCSVRGVYQCQCGKVKSEINCRDRGIFRCENPCEELLPCRRHHCNKGCHAPGKCGECGLQGKKTCPCGKEAYDGKACDAEIPPCGGTCGKVLTCGIHRCHERCHRGPCIETCREVVSKKCRCGGLKKEVACFQSVSCDRKCQKMRDCGNHGCKRRCCDGNCPPCAEICEKRLGCKNHKCPAPCHRGPCAPCPLMVTISCVCRAAHFEVPCGTEMDQRPPRCRKKCDIQPLCDHSSISKPHKCHYGKCPPCQFVCEAEHPCGHTCKLTCHGPRPPPKPDFTLKPKKKKQAGRPECYPGSSCPPCPELVWRSCVGNHLGSDKMMLCSRISEFSCDNLCGNVLKCGNHYCTKACHSVAYSCEECDLRCNKERKCRHCCPLRCHSGECPPCETLVKRTCHCGAMVHVFKCNFYSSLSEDEQVEVRSCGGPCHRKLPYCSHLCPEKCHPGPCPSPQNCSKKVTVRCACHSLKKEMLCRHVQEASTQPLLPCNTCCKSKVTAAPAELHARKPIVVETKDERQTQKRRRRSARPSNLETSDTSSSLRTVRLVAKRSALGVVVLFAFIAFMYLGYHALLHLSDLMNEMDDRRINKYKEF